MSRIHPHTHASLAEGGKLEPNEALRGGVSATSGGTGAAGLGGGSGGGTGSTVSALDDLTDVVLTTPVTGDRLRFDGTFWANSALIWRPVMVLDPTSGNYLPVTASGDAVMVEA